MQLITPQNSLLEKLTGPRLLKKFSDVSNATDNSTTQSLHEKLTGPRLLKKFPDVSDATTNYMELSPS
jgi:uncharacterized protein YbcI